MKLMELESKKVLSVQLHVAQNFGGIVTAHIVAGGTKFNGTIDLTEQGAYFRGTGTDKLISFSNILSIDFAPEKGAKRPVVSSRES